MTLTAIVTFITEIGVLLGVVKWVAKKYKASTAKAELVGEGVKCLLRSDMLHIYYRHKDAEKIRQYEYENFIMLYDAYKALGGNSFIDKIYKEVQTWEVIS
jgi:hypothetical protein